MSYRGQQSADWLLFIVLLYIAATNELRGNAGPKRAVPASPHRQMRLSTVERGQNNFWSRFLKFNTIYIYFTKPATWFLPVSPLFFLSAWWRCTRLFPYYVGTNTPHSFSKPSPPPPPKPKREPSLSGINSLQPTHIRSSGTTLPFSPGENVRDRGRGNRSIIPQTRKPAFPLLFKDPAPVFHFTVEPELDFRARRGARRNGTKGWNRGGERTRFRSF